MTPITVDKRGKFPEFVRSAIPGTTALLVVAGFLFTERIPVLDVDVKEALLLLPAAYVVAVIAAAVVILHRRGTGLREIARESATAVLLGVGAYGHFLITGSRFARLAILAVVAVLLVMYLREIAYAERVGHDEEDVRAFAAFSAALHALIAFFLSATAFAFVSLLQAPAWPLALAIGAVTVFLTKEVLRRHGVTAGTLSISIVCGVLATEAFWGIAALPTPFVANAAVFTILVAVAQQVVLRSMRPTEPQSALRRLVVVSAILIVILLVTARWR